MFAQVEDFGWIKASHSPNWALVPEGERMAAVIVPWERLRGAAAGNGSQDTTAIMGGKAVAGDPDEI